MSLGIGTNYNFGQYVCQIAIPRATTNPTLSVRFKDSEVNSWGYNGWALTPGNKTIWGNLTVNNITLSATGKTNCVGDYHYIQFNQCFGINTNLIGELSLIFWKFGKSPNSGEIPKFSKKLGKLGKLVQTGPGRFSAPPRCAWLHSEGLKHVSDFFPGRNIASGRSLALFIIE